MRGSLIEGGVELAALRDADVEGTTQLGISYFTAVVSSAMYWPQPPSLAITGPASRLARGSLRFCGAGRD